MSHLSSLYHFVDHLNEAHNVPPVSLRYRMDEMKTWLSQSYSDDAYLMSVFSEVYQQFCDLTKNLHENYQKNTDNVNDFRMNAYYDDIRAFLGELTDFINVSEMHLETADQSYVQDIHKDCHTVLNNPVFTAIWLGFEYLEGKKV